MINGKRNLHLQGTEKKKTSYNITPLKMDEAFRSAVRKSLEEGYPKIWIMALKGI